MAVYDKFSKRESFTSGSSALMLDFVLAVVVSY